MNYEQERLRDLNLAKENYNCTEEELKERFGPNTYGSHEVLDRTYLLNENFESFIVSHPAIILDKELYEAAWIINMKMADLYQQITSRER